MAKESIVDASVPSAGRIYDFILGGHHNFEVDRQAAQFILSNVPFVARFMRLQRWCLQDLARELTEVRGYDVIVDFASGLPTQDHLHLVVPKGTTVIYSDYDPVVVEYAREILGDTPNVYFFEADARRPEELLRRPEVEAILGDQRNVALVYWGVAAFLSDDELAHAAKELYAWSGDESCWAFNAQAADVPDDAQADDLTDSVLRMYARMGSPIHLRSKEKYLQLTQPWKPDEKGFLSLLAWHGYDESMMSEEEVSRFGPTGAGYGVYLVK